MITSPKRLRSKHGVFEKEYDMIEYPEGVDIQLAYEFNVYNLGEENVEIQFNEEGDFLTLEPGEGFEVSLPITHAVVKTADSKLKYSYWC